MALLDTDADAILTTGQVRPGEGLSWHGACLEVADLFNDWCEEWDWSFQVAIETPLEAFERKNALVLRKLMFLVGMLYRLAEPEVVLVLPGDGREALTRMRVLSEKSAKATMVRCANTRYKLQLQLKDHGIADAIGTALAGYNELIQARRLALAKG